MTTPSTIILEPFMDDYGNFIFPFQLCTVSYLSRYYFYKNEYN